jgi:hypothetical protein
MIRSRTFKLEHIAGQVGESIALDKGWPGDAGVWQVTVTRNGYTDYMDIFAEEWAAIEALQSVVNKLKT